MNRFHAAVLIATATLAGPIGVPNTSQAAEPTTGKQILDELCDRRGGTAYSTPYAITRCQEARDKYGFDQERQVCEGVLGGTFDSAPSTGRPKRTTWVCVPGPTST
jgi:hypothetical protein